MLQGCVRLGFRAIRWNEMPDNPAPEGRSSLAQRFSAGKKWKNRFKSRRDGRVRTQTRYRFATAGGLFQKAVERFGLRQLLGNRPIESLQKSVLRVEIVRNTRILEIAATLPDPQRAQALARFLADETVEMNRAIAMQGALDLVEAVAQEERRAQARLQETDAAWSHMLAGEPVDALQSDLTVAAGERK